MEYQVTLICASNKYRPVSAIVKASDKESFDLNNREDKKEIIKRGIQKICIARSWGSRELKLYEYTKSKVRVYDKVKIEQENKERYERIKEQHYQDGTWKRPNKKIKKGIDK